MPVQATSGRGNAPPYVPYPSFKTLIGELHEHGVPSRVDRSVLRRFSGIIGSQLLTALRFLRLIDDHSHPTARLTELVAASGTPEWGPKMISVLQEEYAPLFGLDLGNATASHFDETFRKSFPGSADSVSQKSIAFFLGAAKDSGIIISDRVLHGRKLRVGPPGSAPRRFVVKPKPKPKPAAQAGSNSNPPRIDTNNDNVPVLQLDPLLMQLLLRIPPQGDEWPKEQRLRWLKTFAVNVSEVYDDAATPVDFKIELADASKSSGHGE